MGAPHREYKRSAEAQDVEDERAQVVEDERCVGAVDCTALVQQFMPHRCEVLRIMQTSHTSWATASLERFDTQIAQFAKKATDVAWDSNATHARMNSGLA